MCLIIQVQRLINAVLNLLLTTFLQFRCYQFPAWKQCPLKIPHFVLFICFIEVQLVYRIIFQVYDIVIEYLRRSHSIKVTTKQWLHFPGYAMCSHSLFILYVVVHLLTPYPFLSFTLPAGLFSESLSLFLFCNIHSSVLFFQILHIRITFFC